MTVWPTATLVSLTRAPQYGAIASGAKAPIGPRFVRQTDIASGRIDWDSVPYCDLDPSDFEKYALHRGDLLISRLGNGVGNAAIVREPHNAVFAGYLVRFQADPLKADPGYLGYALQSQDWRDHVASYRSGAAQPTLNAKQMGAFELPLPSLPEQRAIAAPLVSLDDKIESNRRLISLVPELIRSRVEEHIVQGASDVSVSSLAKFVNGGAYTKGATGSGRMVVRIAELNSGPGASTVYNELDVPDDKTAHAGDILMSWSGSLGVYRWARDEAIINQHIFKVIPTGYPAWLVFDRIDAIIDVFRGYAADKATTMGHIKRGDLDTTTVQLPREEALRELDVALEPLWDRLLIAEQEVLRLEALRDAMLPELLSGRIRVPEAQEVET
jgi:type I restriction enzyme S subunit